VVAMPKSTRMSDAIMPPQTWARFMTGLLEVK
jgi:hypothetical protein